MLQKHAPEYLSPAHRRGAGRRDATGGDARAAWADVDARPGWIRLRGETTKSGRTRWVPVDTLRLQAVLGYPPPGSDGSHQAGGGAAVCSYGTGSRLPLFRTAWDSYGLRANGIIPGWTKGRDSGCLTAECRAAYRRIDLRWHDLRHEYAPRLVERGFPCRRCATCSGMPRSSRRSGTTTRSPKRCSLRRSGSRQEQFSRFLQDRREAADETPIRRTDSADNVEGVGEGSWGG